MQQISKTTFTDTYAGGNTQENMHAYLEAHFSLAQLKKEISNPESFFYFARHKTQVVGYLKLNMGQAQSETQKAAVEIERIYVLKNFQGQHIGKTLFQKALAIAQKKQLQFVWLGVWENNPRAIAFYTTLGFIPYDKHLFKLGDDLQTDIIMRLEL